jgi:hypothetical protein
MGELGPEGADAPRRDRWLAPVLGLVAGVGLATKITFAPLCLLALLTRRTWREAGWTLGAMGAGTAGALAPAFSEVPRMLRWFERLATHTGTYGTGAEGFVDPTRYLSGIGSMVLADRVLLVLAVVAVVVGGAGGRWWGGEVVRARHRRLLLLTAGVQILGVLLVAKHPHPRYLVPVAISAAFNAVLLADLVRRVGPRPGGRWIRRGALGLGLVGTILVWSDGRELAQELRGVRDRQLSFVREVDDLAARGRHVDYYRSSSVAFALHFGNGTAWRLFAEPLAELHPGRLFFNRFTGRFETFAGPVPFDQVAGNAPLFLVGTGGIESPVPGGIGLPPPGWSLIAVRRSGEMTLHRLGPEKRPP